MSIKHQHLAYFITAWYVFFAVFWFVGLFSLVHYDIPMWLEWLFSIFRSIIDFIADVVNVEFGNIPGGFACVTIFAFAAASILLITMLMLRILFCNHNSLRSSPTSAAPAAQTSLRSSPTSPPPGGPTSAAPAAPTSRGTAAPNLAAKQPNLDRTSFFYNLLALAALLLGLFLFHMVERITYGVNTYWGFVPGGLAILFRYRYCLFIVPLLLFALGMLSSRTAWPRTPVATACAAIATLLIFFYAALMLATPVIAKLPIDYDVDRSVPLRISAEEPAAPTSPPQGGPTSLRSSPTSAASPPQPRREAAQTSPPPGGPTS